MGKGGKNRVMTTYFKQKKKVLSTKEYRNLRVELYNKYLEHCPECHRWRTLDQMHIHHIKSLGAGGDDSIENIAWLCYKCHREGP